MKIPDALLRRGLPLFLLAGCPAALGAQDIGILGGASGKTDRAYVGVHAQTPALAGGLRLRLGYELGFGGPRTVGDVAGHVLYEIPIRTGSWVYLGVGPALVVVRQPQQVGSTPFSIERDSYRPGFDALAGLRIRERYLVEVKLGALDSPEYKVGFGYMFPLGGD